MMGDRLVMQESLFYQFRLDDHVPADHMLRGIDRFLDLGGLRRHLAPFYSTTGRPSIDPELTIRILLVGPAYPELYSSYIPYSSISSPYQPVLSERAGSSRPQAVIESLAHGALRAVARERKKIGMLFAHLKRIIDSHRKRPAMPVASQLRTITFPPITCYVDTASSISVG